MIEPLLTIVQFFFITNSNDIDTSEFRFKFGSSETEYELDELDCISPPDDNHQSKVYYCEEITIKYKSRIISSFHFLIYRKKCNVIILDLDEKNKPSFELLFYTKDQSLNPKSVKYKNVEYTQLVNYGNKYRSRIFFANVDPKKLQYINSEAMAQYKIIFDNNETYHALLRIPYNNKIEISLTKMNYYYDIKEDIIGERSQFSKNEFQSLEKLLNEFCKKYDEFISLNSLTNEKRKVSFIELKELSQIITSDELYSFIDEPSNYKIAQVDKEVLALFHMDFNLTQFLEISEIIENRPNQFELLRFKAVKYRKMVSDLFAQLNNDKNINIEEKIQILRTITIFFNNSLHKDNNNIFGVKYINLKNISPQNPYFKSIQMLKKLISEITEDSRLFEAFMYFDSDIIQNILMKNTQTEYNYINIFGRKTKINQPEFITEYGMSLMTVQEIKQHLIQILPSIIIKIDNNIDMRALYEKKTKQMVINEVQMFGTFINENEELFKMEPDNYILPIFMEILCEILGHGLLRNNKNKSDNSPLVLRDSKYNFQVQKLIKKVKLDFDNEVRVNKGESSKVLEHYISEDTNVIQKLKKRNNNIELNDTKYWTGKNFNSLHRALGLSEENENMSNFQEEINIDDHINDQEDYYDCVI